MAGFADAPADYRDFHEVVGAGLARKSGHAVSVGPREYSAIDGELSPKSNSVSQYMPGLPAVVFLRSFRSRATGGEADIRGRDAGRRKAGNGCVFSFDEWELPGTAGTNAVQQGGRGEGR